MAASLVHGALCVINSHIGLTPAAQNSCCSYKLVANYQPCLTFVFFVIFQSLSHELQTSKCDNGSVWHSCLFRVLIRNINSEVGSEVWVPGTDVSND